LTIKIIKTNICLRSNIRRILLRPFDPTSEERAIKIVNRVLSLSAEEIRETLDRIITDFGRRHRNLKSFFVYRFEQQKKYVPPSSKINDEQKLLIGAYFTLEYALEAAALFNPSLVWHPDQSGLTGARKRFIISLRATGEGHISSICFRSGIIDQENNISLDEPTAFVSTPAIKINKDGYDAIFTPEQKLSERILFPSAPEESNGMEDARFVEFTDDNGNREYYATYTAYDGSKTHSMFLATMDFRQFRIKKLTGNAIQNKGLALFPRKINGKYVMLSRQDNENNYIMYSDEIDFWGNKQLLMEPQYPWEFFQIGNCGCPIETDQGWLVLSHGVGPMRQYVISAFLLDLNEPDKVIGRLKHPLMVANEEEREGYVPNVLYTCGSQIHGSNLFFPYAMSDYSISFALIKLKELLGHLT
jgi:predicted GH43/DUF377 family glycosyl hydrolase